MIQEKKWRTAGAMSLSRWGKFESSAQVKGLAFDRNVKSSKGRKAKYINEDANV